MLGDGSVRFASDSIDEKVWRGVGSIGGAVSTSNPSLAPGNAFFTLVVSVDSALPLGATIRNTVQATTTTAEHNTANNRATIQTSLPAPIVNGPPPVPPLVLPAGPLLVRWLAKAFVGLSGPSTANLSQQALQAFLDQWVPQVSRLGRLRGRVRVRDREGGYRWIRNSAGLERGTDGVVAIFGITQDLTAEIEARERLIRQQRQLAEAGRVAGLGFWRLPLGSDLFDLSGRVVWRLPRTSMAAGQHLIPWNGQDASGRRVSAGTYFARVHRDSSLDLRTTVIRLR